MIKLKVTRKKDGREVHWFREAAGRVVVRDPGMNWVKAQQIRDLAEYGIELQKEQVAAGLGSDGAPMPPLKEGGKAVFVARVNGKAVFARRGYAAKKTKLGLNPFRDLRGEGIGGHMLDDIRVNYMSDRECRYGITRSLSRKKALANEQRAPWWGWSTTSVQKLTARAAEIFGTGMAEYLMSVGLISAQTVNRIPVRTLGRAA